MILALRRPHPLNLRGVKPAQNRWNAFSDDELMSIESAAWVEDQEYGMSEALRPMLPEIAVELERRGWQRHQGAWRSRKWRQLQGLR